MAWGYSSVVVGYSLAPLAYTKPWATFLALKGNLKSKIKLINIFVLN